VNSDAMSSLDITIFGCSHDIVASILKRHAAIELKVGYGNYENNLKLLYRGWLMYGSFYNEGVESYLKLSGSVFDYYAQSKDAKPAINKTWKPPCDSDAILREILDAMKLDVVQNDFKGDAILKAYSINGGDLITVLSSFFRDFQKQEGVDKNGDPIFRPYHWTMQNGKITIRDPDSALIAQTVDVNWGNGLLTLPTTSGSGITFTCLISPRIVPLTVIQLDPTIPVKRTSFNSDVQNFNINYGGTGFVDSRVAKTGKYLVFDVTHVGDSMGEGENSWCSMVQCNKLDPKDIADENQ